MRNNMTNLTLRSTIRALLLEGIGPMALKGFLKKWIEHLGDVGVDASQEVFNAITSSYYNHSHHGKEGIQAYRLDTKLNALNLFKDLSPDLQAWALEHWNNEEYFAEVFANINVGIVIEFKGRAAGLKTGELNFWVKKKGDTAKLSSIGNYLLANRGKMGFQYQGDTSGWQKIQYSPDHWAKACLNDIANEDSTFIHEFQHWFQSSVYYGDERIKGQTMPRKSGNLDPNLIPPKKMIIPFIEAIFKGVDFSKKFKYKGALAYKIKDFAAFGDSVAFQNFRDKMHYIRPIEQYFKSGATSATNHVNRLFNLSDEDWAEINDPQIDWWPHWGDSGSKKEGQVSILQRALSKKKENKRGGIFRFEDLGVVTVGIIKGNLGKNVAVSDTGNIEGKMARVSAKNNDHKKLLFVVFHKGDFTKDVNPNGRWTMFPGGYNQEWKEMPSEYDAESRNYIAGSAQEMVTRSYSFQRSMLKGDAKSMIKELTPHVEYRLRQRFARKLHKEKWPEVENLIPRLVDRMIEQAELHSPEDLVPQENWDDLDFVENKGGHRRHGSNYFRELWNYINGSKK